MRWGGYSAAGERLVTGILVTGTPARPVDLRHVERSALRSRHLEAEPPGHELGRCLEESSERPTAGDGSTSFAAFPDRTPTMRQTAWRFRPTERPSIVAQGSQTNEGAPSEDFGNVPEYELSGALLSIDLARIGERTYDLPTRDDPSR